MEHCLCGHSYSIHTKKYGMWPEADVFCQECYIENGKELSWHNFKLDNLKYIEDLAKEKGLV